MPSAALNTGTQHIEPEECLQLLATQELGRLAVGGDNGPEIFPVNYVLDSGSVVFRTDLGTKLAGATGRPVVFEVDHVDRGTATAWSVIVHGRALHLSDLESAMLRARISRLSLYPIVSGDKPFVLRIAATTVTGRRIPVRG